MSLPDRNHSVDAVRTVALMGICVVNIPFMAMPPKALLSPPAGATDATIGLAVEFLFQAKFFLLFSFIFGWGIEIQARAAQRAGASFARRYGRRLATLGVLGALHALFVFAGDILLLYAILGLIAWPLRKSSPRRLLQVAAAMVPLAAVSILALGLLLNEIPATPLEPGLGGSYVDTVQARLRDWPAIFAFLVLFQGHLALAAILVGIAAARTDFFEPGSSGRRWLSRAEPWLLGVGIVCNLFYVLAASAGRDPMPGPMAIGTLMIALGGPALSAVYLSIILRLSARWKLPPVLVLAGRNSLSAYVLQGVLAGLLFGSYGLGLFGAFSFAALLPVSVLIALAAMLIVGQMAKYLGMGPLEFVLRRATYG